MTALTVCCCVLDAPLVHAQALHVEDRYFRDQAGGVVVLRGLNVAGDSKVPPFRPIDDPALLDGFPEWGVNVARLLFTWEAFEPTRGSYDESYFAYYLATIAALHERGVYVIVDLHQDAFSRFATDGCGEGMPEWAVSAATQKHTPDNGPNCSSWGIKFILDTDTHRCWDDFYADTDGVRTRYLTLLDTLASRLSSHPAVIGYDMLNEPWGDEVKQLGPLYEDAAKVIRAHAPETILFVSPQALTSGGQDTKLVRPSFENFAYSPHFYDGGIVLAHIWTGSDLKEPVGRMEKQAVTWNVPLFVGEFGAPAGATNGAAYLDAYYRELDAVFSSAAQWSFVGHHSEERKDGWNTEDFSIVDGKGVLRDNYRVRPYAARIAGEPLSFEVRAGSALEVELAWNHEPALGATRIFAPALRLFGSQVRATIDGDARCVAERDGRHVRCMSDTTSMQRVVLSACTELSACLVLAPEPPTTVDAGIPSSLPEAGASAPDGQGMEPSRASRGGGCTVVARDGSTLLSCTLLSLVFVYRARSRRRPQT